MKRPSRSQPLSDLPISALAAATGGLDDGPDIVVAPVLRSGFINAGPSSSDRIIERHEVNGNEGGFWISSK
jgi:hypothetical protein